MCFTILRTITVYNHSRVGLTQEAYQYFHVTGYKQPDIPWRHINSYSSTKELFNHLPIKSSHQFADCKKIKGLVSADSIQLLGDEQTSDKTNKLSVLMRCFFFIRQTSTSVWSAKWRWLWSWSRALVVMLSDLYVSNVVAATRQSAFHSATNRWVSK